MRAYGSLPLVPHFESGAVTLADADRRRGWFGLLFYVRAHGRLLPAGGGAGRATAAGGWTWHGTLAPRVDVRLHLARARTGAGIVITPTLINRARTPFVFDGYGFGIAAGAGGVLVTGPSSGPPVYAHTDNLRYESLPHCRIAFPFIRPLPTTPTLFGAQASNPIPALALGQADSDLWLLEGAVTQTRHAPAWELAIPSAPERHMDYRGQFVWTGGAAERVPAGARLTLETTFFGLVRAPPDRLYAPYLDELAARHRFAGAASRLRYEAVYSTWNYGVFTQLTEADCLRRMAVAARAQRGGYFQIDHGYQQPDPATGQAAIDADVFYPDPRAAWDTARFPSGPRGFTRACRRHGLRPAIWWSPRIALHGVIQRTHPEWLLRDRAGRPIVTDHLLLDPSVPAVHAWIARVLRTLIGAWGFEGIKVDFYSYMFDHPRAVFHHGQTGLHWKRWFHRLVRTAVGPRGYFLHCISCPMGNPFLALEGCDAFRAGMDIHTGEWPLHVRTAAWALPLVLSADRRTWFADLDGFFGAPEIPARERRSRAAFGYISGGLLDFSGPIERLDRAALADYRRLCERCDQGAGVECPEDEPFFGRPLPSLLLRRHAPSSRTRRRWGIIATIGFFNWGDTPRALAIPRARLGWTAARLRATDFWTGRAVRQIGDGLQVSLAPRDHALWDLAP